MISVIIPVYNAERFVRIALESILNQTEKNLQILILDDCSTDNSYDILKEYKDDRLTLVKNTTNIGYLRSINKLLGYCKGKYVAFQDADDLSHSLRFEKQKRLLESRPDISIIGTNYSVISESGRELSRHHVEENATVLSNQLIKKNPFQKPSIMFRREVYEKIGGYREAFLSLGNISEDFDWLLRASQYFKFGNINANDPLYQYRSVELSMTKNFDNVEQLFGPQVALHLHSQRIQSGSDDLERGDLSNVLEFVEKLRQPYLDDPSRFFREKAESLMYYGLKWKSFSYACRAFFKEPSFSNLRLVQYCLRKSVIGK